VSGLNPPDDYAFGAEEETRQTLTRVLASESRDALARVELAASEIERFETSPSLRGRVGTIRAAVAEIDALLSKIDLLSDLDRHADHGAVDFVSVCRAAIARVGHVMSARGVVFEAAENEGLASSGEALVSMPAAALESMVFGLARLATHARGATESVEYSFHRREGFACLSLCVRAEQGTRNAQHVAFDRVAKLELDVDVAEWSGHLVTKEGPGFRDVGFALPLHRSGEEVRSQRNREEGRRV